MTLRLAVFTVLALAAAGSALAQAIIETAPPGAQPKASGGSDLGSAQMMAVVLADGTLVTAQSKGTAPCQEAGGSCRANTGTYNVYFTRDITKCSYTATSGGTWHPNATLISSNFVSLDAGTIPTRVRVGVYTHAGNNVDGDFTIQVLC